MSEQQEDQPVISKRHTPAKRRTPPTRNRAKSEAIPPPFPPGEYWGDPISEECLIDLLFIQPQLSEALPRPTSYNLLEWRAYWTSLGQTWRTQPEIDDARKKELLPPFAGVALCRADVEWLLASYEYERGLIDWNPATQHERQGLDLHGAILRGQQLFSLPLTRVDLHEADLEHAELAGSHLEGANLNGANLKEASLSFAFLEAASFNEASLTDAKLSKIQADWASFREAHLERAEFYQARLRGADFTRAWLGEAHFREAQMEGAQLFGIKAQGVKFYITGLKKADLRSARLEQAVLADAQLQGAYLTDARLQEANMERTQLQNASLAFARLQGTSLKGAQLQGASLEWANLGGADLRSAVLDANTILGNFTVFDQKTQIADVAWNNTPLTLINWQNVPILGDEYQARQPASGGRIKERWLRLSEYQAAVRANRQLAVALRAQGLNEEANRFAYRAQVLQRQVQRLQIDLPPWMNNAARWMWTKMIQVARVIALPISPMILALKPTILALWRISWVSKSATWILRQIAWIPKFLLYLGSLCLDGLAGYGYKPGRSLLIYICMIAAFASGFYWVTHTFKTQTYPLAWYEALILSVISFHGRGFFMPVQTLGDPVSIMAAIEAVFGLLIEISFIATFTQRYFGK
ncbi:MAG TPA: pentapeptide repeat-containing protein [Ktedonobacteraceae bacterium]|nr:pentapeptide repeat-containing protein [Ktedonobacteraceae bacterium]